MHVTQENGVVRRIEEARLFAERFPEPVHPTHKAGEGKRGDKKRQPVL